MEKLKLNVSELRDIVYDDSNEFEVVQEETIGTWRHGNEETTVVKRLSDGKFFEINWRSSVKYSCGFKDMNFDGEYDEVLPYTETITKYR